MMKLFEEVSKRNNTHDCPVCKSATYCAMMAGKSANTCWCMTQTADNKLSYFEFDSGDMCMCKKCLTGKD